MSDQGGVTGHEPTSTTPAASASPLGSLESDHAHRARPRALVLLEPRGAFLAVRARPLSALVFGVMLAVSLAPPLAFVLRVDTAEVLERELRKSGQLEKLPPEQLEQARAIGGAAMSVALPLGALGKRATWMLVVSGLALLLLRGSRPELRFGAVLGAVALGSAPSALHDVATALSFLVREPSSFADAQNVVLSNPAAWLGLDTGRSVTGALLHGLDFFTLWTCGLVALGINVVAGARSAIPWALTYGLHLAFVGLSTIGPATQSG